MAVGSGSILKRRTRVVLGVDPGFGVCVCACVRVCASLSTSVCVCV